MTGAIMITIIIITKMCHRKYYNIYYKKCLFRSQVKILMQRIRSIVSLLSSHPEFLAKYSASFVQLSSLCLEIFDIYITYICVLHLNSTDWKITLKDRYKMGYPLSGKGIGKCRCKQERIKRRPYS